MLVGGFGQHLIGPSVIHLEYKKICDGELKLIITGDVTGNADFLFAVHPALRVSTTQYTVFVIDI